MRESNNSIATFLRCKREYRHAYVEKRVAINRGSEALDFGTLFHRALNAWWECTGMREAARYEAAIDTIPGDTDPFIAAKARALLAGYSIRWANEQKGLYTIAVEHKFRLPILRGSSIIGSIDAIASKSNGMNASTVVAEHKTTTQDIAPSSPYWRQVIALDPQVSTYMIAAESEGYAPKSIMYDVIRKPSMKPYVETPDDEKLYTKPTKAEPVPRLYKSQRDRDETPEEYEARLTNEIVTHPEMYFQRATIVRLPRDHEEHMRDLKETMRAIQFATERSEFSRTPGSCIRYGRLCEYHDVCAGQAELSDNSRYEDKDESHRKGFEE